MKKRITLIVLCGMVFLISLIDYFQSFYTYDDLDPSSGKHYFGFGFDTDLLIITITAVLLLALSIYLLVKYIKRQKVGNEVNYACMAMTLFNASYGLFTMIKIIGKAVNKLYYGGQFNLAYSDVDTYLYWGLLSATLFIYLLFGFLENKNK